jgi:hypothetical protein
MLDKVVTAACDRTVIIWDSRKGLPLHRALLEQPATCLHLDRRAEVLLFASTDGAVCSVAFASLPGLAPSTGATFLTSPAFNQHGHGSGNIPRLDPTAIVRSTEKHGDWVVTMTSVPSKKLVASGARDRVIMIWDPTTAECQRKLVGHTRAVAALECLEDQSILVSSEIGTGNVFVWNLMSASSGPSQRLSHDSDVVTVMIDRFSQAIVVVEMTSRISVWDSTRMALRHVTDIADSTKPPSTLKRCAIMPSTRDVVGVYTTHIATFGAKKREDDHAQYGPSVICLHLDAATFTLAVVTRTVVTFFNAVDGTEIRSIAHPFGKKLPTEGCLVADGVMFLTAAHYVAAYRLAGALHAGAFKRVLGITHDERLEGAYRSAVAKNWIFVLSSGAMHMGKLRLDGLEYVFERVTQLSSVTSLQFSSAALSRSGGHSPANHNSSFRAGLHTALTVKTCVPWRLDLEAAGSTSRSDPTARFASGDGTPSASQANSPPSSPRSPRASRSSAIAADAYGTVLFHRRGHNVNPVMTFNTRTLARSFGSLDNREEAMDATFLQTRCALAVLHVSTVTVYSVWNFHRVLEISAVTDYIRASPKTINWVGGDRVVLSGGGSHGVALIDVSTAFNHFYANVSDAALHGHNTTASSSQSTSAPLAPHSGSEPHHLTLLDNPITVSDGEDDESPPRFQPSVDLEPARSELIPPMHKGKTQAFIDQPLKSTAKPARFVAAPHPPPRHAFASSVFFCVDESTGSDVIVKVHDLACCHDAEVAVRRALPRSLDEVLVPLIDAWVGPADDDRDSQSPRRSPAAVTAPAMGDDTRAADKAGAGMHTRSAVTPMEVSHLIPTQTTVEDVRAIAHATLSRASLHRIGQSAQAREACRKRRAELTHGIAMQRGDGRLADLVGDGQWTSLERDRCLEAVLRACTAVCAAGFAHTHLRPRHVMRFGHQWKLVGLDSLCALGGAVYSIKDTGANCPPEWAAADCAGDPVVATESAMVWAFASMAYEVAVRKPLFAGATESAMFEAIANVSDAKLSTAWPQVAIHSKAAAVIVRQGLKRDPAARCTFAELQVLLMEESKRDPAALEQGFSASSFIAPTPKVATPSPAQALRDGVRAATSQLLNESISAAPDFTENGRQVLPTIVGTAATATVVLASSATTTQLTHPALSAPVSVVHSNPDSSLLLAADVDAASPSGGVVHLLSLPASSRSLGYHGNVPPFDVGVPTAEGRWTAPLRLLSGAARRSLATLPGLGARDNSRTTVDRDGDEAACLADALASLGPILPPADDRHNVLQRWETLTRDEVSAAMDDTTTTTQSELDILFAFEMDVARRSRFYDDTGARRQPGEKLVLYAPQTKMRLDQLEQAKVLASKAERQMQRSKLRLQRVVDESRHESGLDRSLDASGKQAHALSPDFIRRVPRLGQDANGGEGAPYDPHGVLLLQALAPVNYELSPMRDDPALVANPRARSAFMLAVARRPSFVQELTIELQRHSPHRSPLAATTSPRRSSPPKEHQPKQRPL